MLWASTCHQTGILWRVRNCSSILDHTSFKKRENIMYPFLPSLGIHPVSYKYSTKLRKSRVESLARQFLDVINRGWVWYHLKKLVSKFLCIIQVISCDWMIPEKYSFCDKTWFCVICATFLWKPIHLRGVHIGQLGKNGSKWWNLTEPNFFKKKLLVPLPPGFHFWQILTDPPSPLPRRGLGPLVSHFETKNSRSWRHTP